MSLDLNVRTSQGSRNYDILLKTLIGEAASEPEQGQRAICQVIGNRVRGNKIYWYDEKEGNNIAGVCLAKYQFECWNSGEKRRQLENSLQTDWARREMTRIQKWLKDVYSGSNPIGACDHYNNPNKEARPGWMDRVDFVITIGNHHFCRTKPEYR